MGAAMNPVVQRLEKLLGQWWDFVEKPEGRVLCWLVESDEYAMVNAFVAIEDDERGAQTDDVFVPLSTPFVAGRYGEGLLREFLEKAKALHAGLGEASVPEWQPPPSPPSPSTPSGTQRPAKAPDAPEPPDALPFLQACESFASHYKLPGKLALVLTPSECPDGAAFGQWLDALARTALPGSAKLRLVVLDDKRAPSLGALVKAHPDRVVAVFAELDMAGARLEISETAGNLDKPGGQLRHQFVQMTNALGKQDLASAETHSQVALDITSTQGWHALAVPIHLAMGASLAAAGKVEPANARYLKAEASAAEGETAGDPVCAKLKVQARLCRGSLLILESAWQAAAALYVQTLPMALALEEPGMVIDCYRLASFCLEQNKQHQLAWQQGVDGLAFAHTVEKKALAATTLPYLSESLSRLGKQKQFASSWKRAEGELVTLLGPEWRPPAHVPAEDAKGAGGAAANGTKGARGTA
jgi:hypothetical protein